MGDLLLIDCDDASSGPLIVALQEAGHTLLREVWGDDRGVTTRTVDTHVKRLRKKLGPVASCIRSVRGVGYGFDAPPEKG